MLVYYNKGNFLILRNTIFLAFFILSFAFNLKAKDLQSAPLVAQPTFFKLSNLDTRWRFSAWRWQEGLNDSLGVLLNLRLNWEKELISNLLFQVTLDLNASKSRLQQHVFGKNSSKIYSLREAKLVFFPISDLSLETGALSESFWKKDLLISGSSTFIGARQSWGIWNKETLSVDLHLEQSIPPSSSSDSFRVENEKLPYFFMAQGDIDYKQKDWSLKSHLFYAQYFNLPTIIAFESGLLGNDADNNAAATSAKFRSEFGLVGAGMDYYYSLWGAGLESYILWNSKAHISSVAKARFVKLYFDQVSLFSQDLTLALEKFFIEPDATVAYYNTSSYGNTNRKGFTLEVIWKITSLSKINLRYIQSSLINKQSLRDQLQSVSLGLEYKL